MGKYANVVDGQMAWVCLSRLGLPLRNAGAAVAVVGRRARLLDTTQRIHLAPGNCVAAAVISSLGLASCSSVAMPGFDSLKPKPTTTLLLIESNPGGAEARSSLGQTCHTPCTMQIGAGNDFTVNFSLDGYVPQTLTVHATMSEGGYMTAASPKLDPGTLFPTLERVKTQAGPRKPLKQRPAPAAAAEGAQQ